MKHAPSAQEPLPPCTLDQMRADMLARGLAVKEWAIGEGFKPAQVEHFLPDEATQ